MWIYTPLLLDFHSPCDNIRLKCQSGMAIKQVSDEQMSISQYHSFFRRDIPKIMMGPSADHSDSLFFIKVPVGIWQRECQFRPSQRHGGSLVIADWSRVVFICQCFLYEIDVLVLWGAVGICSRICQKHIGPFFFFFIQMFGIG